MIKNLLNQIIEYRHQKKNEAKKMMLRKSIQLYKIENDIFSFIKPHLSTEKIIILDSILSSINDITRTNNIEYNIRNAQSCRSKLMLPPSNYEVLMIERQNHPDKPRFTKLGKKQDFEWFEINIVYQYSSENMVKVSIIGQNGLFLEYNTDVIYEFEDSYKDTPYQLQLKNITDF